VHYCSVEQPKEATDWHAHVPRRQWVIVLSGRVEVTTSDGERRQFGPGAFVLVEDIVGKGHVSTPLTPDYSFVMIPVAAS
jgi:quercetin dioxygenase-like cupin family protein